MNYKGIPFIVCLLFTVAAFGCASGEQEPSAPGDDESLAVTYDIVLSGQQASIQTQSAVVVSDQETWNAVFRSTQGAVLSDETPPIVNFDEHRLLVLFAGSRSTGGYSIEVESIEESDASIDVRVRVLSPAPDAMVTQVITSPFVVVQLRTTRDDITVRFE